MLFDGDVFPLCLLRNRDRAFRKDPYAVTHHGRGNRCVLSHILLHSQGISSLRNVVMLFVLTATSGRPRIFTRLEKRFLSYQYKNNG